MSLVNYFCDRYDLVLYCIFATMKYKFHSILFFFFISFAIQAQDRHTIDSLKNQISISKSDTLTVGLLNDLAGEYSEIDRDSAIYYLNQALIFARELDEPKFKARTYNNLGSNYCFKGEYLKALEYLDLAENIAKEYSYKNYQAYVHYTKSIVFLSIDKLNLANEHATKALELYQEMNLLSNVGGIYTLFSTIFGKLDDHQKSLEYAKKSYRIKLQLNDTLGLSAALNNLGTNYYQVNQIDSAYLYTQKAIVLNKKYNLQSWLAINYQNLSEYMLEEGKVDSADFYIQMASEIYQETSHMMNFYNTIEAKAKIALARKDTLAAIGFYITIIESPKHLESLNIKVIAYYALHKIAIARGQYVEAVDYYKSYKLFDDSLKKETNTSLLSVLELQIEYEKHRNLLQLENKEVKLKSQQKNFYLIMMAGLIFLLGLTIYFVYRLQRIKSKAIRIEKQRIEEELDSKKREMTANVMTLLKKNEILSGISRKLLEIEKGAVKDETKEAISKISDEVRESKDVELWDEFDVRFRQVHYEFYDNLLQNYPDLSPNEQRMCAFLRMNMATKDISELTGLDRRTVDNTRYKIRKKLDLDSKTNLISFLSKL